MNTVNYKNPLEENQVKAFLTEKGRATEIKDIVNDIIVSINKKGFELPRIARDAKEIEVFRHDPYQKNKTFEGMIFGRVNLIEALHAITVYEAFILQAENKFLNWRLNELIQKERMSLVLE